METSVTNYLALAKYRIPLRRRSRLPEDPLSRLGPGRDDSDRWVMPQEQAAQAGADWRLYEPLELTPILTAALEAFYEHGFHGTTVRDIARRVGQTVPSLYYHHDSKEGAFVALLELSAAEATWRVKAAAAAGDGTRQKFMNVIETIVLHMAHRTRLAALDLELRHLSPPNRKRYAAHRKEIETLLTEILETGEREAVFTLDDPAETARALLGMCQSIARWFQPDGPLDPSQLAERYVRIALAAAGAVHVPPNRGVRQRKSATPGTEAAAEKRQPRRRSAARSQ